MSYNECDGMNELPSTTDELMKAVLAILPGATFEDDNDGQIVIYTNNKQDKEGNLLEM